MLNASTDSTADTGVKQIKRIRKICMSLSGLTEKSRTVNVRGLCDRAYSLNFGGIARSQNV